MGIKTEDFVPNMPGKEMTEGVDWLGILDGFDPSGLEQKYLDECARRDPYNTCYKWDTPARPVEERQQHLLFGHERRRLELCVTRIENEGLTPVGYKNARAALIKAIGEKGAIEYNRREAERLGEAGLRKQAEAYAAWEKAANEKSNRRKKIYAIAEEHPGFASDMRFDGEYYIEKYGLTDADLDELDEMVEEEREAYLAQTVDVSVREKVIRIRKGLKGTNGKPLTQRDFAKLIGYPINKYQEAEKIDRWGREPETPMEYELLEKLVMICHANPYWLFDYDCEASEAGEDFLDVAIKYGDVPCVFAKPDVILKWIREGKPRETDWLDGVVCPD